MKWFMNLKIGVKLISGFLIVTLVAVIVGVVGISNIRSLNKSGDILYSRNTVPLEYMTDYNRAFQRIRVNLRNALLTSAADQREIELEKSGDRQKDIDEAEVKIREAVKGREDLRLAFEKVSADRVVFNSEVKRLKKLIIENKDEEALSILAETGSSGIATRNLINSLDVMGKNLVAAAKERAEENTKEAKSAVVTVVTFIIVGAGIAVFLGVFLSRIISKQVNTMVAVANRLAQGDIDVNLEINTTDEMGTKWAP